MAAEAAKEVLVEGNRELSFTPNDGKGGEGARKGRGKRRSKRS